MALTDKLTAIADAIRGKTGGTDPLTLDGMATAIAGIEAGVGLDLLYETEFSLDESVTSGTVSVAVFETGLNLAKGDNVCAVIRCVNDTDADTSYNHFKARVIHLTVNTSLAQTTIGWGTNYSAENVHNITGATGAMNFKRAGKYCESITLQTNGDYAGYGKAPSGDYSLKLYLLSKENLGLEGI